MLKAFTREQNYCKNHLNFNETPQHIHIWMKLVLGV